MTLLNTLRGNGESTISGDIIHHISISISLIEASKHHKLVNTEVLVEMIKEMAKDSSTVREQAVWETYLDFFDVTLDEGLDGNVREEGTGLE
jgi:predicted nucleic acid-binding protein